MKHSKLLGKEHARLSYKLAMRYALFGKGECGINLRKGGGAILAYRLNQGNQWQVIFHAYFHYAVHLLHCIRNSHVSAMVVEINLGVSVSGPRTCVFIPCTAILCWDVRHEEAWSATGNRHVSLTLATHTSSAKNSKTVEWTNLIAPIPAMMLAQLLELGSPCPAKGPSSKNGESKSRTKAMRSLAVSGQKC